MSTPYCTQQPHDGGTNTLDPHPIRLCGMTSGEQDDQDFILYMESSHPLVRLKAAKRLDHSSMLAGQISLDMYQKSVAELDDQIRELELLRLDDSSTDRDLMRAVSSWES